MLIALCVAYAFAPARAVTFVAAKRPVFHTGQTDDKPRFAAFGSASKLAALAPPAVKKIFNTILQQGVLNFSFDYPIG